MKPLKIGLDKEKNLTIHWADGSNQKISLFNLRKNCPCAECKAEIDGHGGRYIPIYFGEQIEVQSISLVGTYGIQLNWKDGHNTGIFEFVYLRKFGNEEAVR